jgi:peptidoglycan hydrolase CwlO-like protein
LRCSSGAECQEKNISSETELETANRHIADATRRIADLKALIEKQRQAGQSTQQAEELLAVLEQGLALMIDHRDTILRSLDG